MSHLKNVSSKTIDFPIIKESHIQLVINNICNRYLTHKIDRQTKDHYRTWDKYTYYELDSYKLGKQLVDDYQIWLFKFITLKHFQHIQVLFWITNQYVQFQPIQLSRKSRRAHQYLSPCKVGSVKS